MTVAFHIFLGAFIWNHSKLKCNTHIKSPLEIIFILSSERKGPTHFVFKSINKKIIQKLAKTKRQLQLNLLLQNLRTKESIIFLNAIYASCPSGKIGLAPSYFYEYAFRD